MTTKQRAALTARDIESAQPREAAYRLHDAKMPGLSLRVLPSGVKSWSVTWMRNRELALGKWPAVTLDMARTKARAKLAETDTHGAPLVVVEASKPLSEKPITVLTFIDEHFKPWALTHQKQGQATINALAAVWAELYDRDLREVSAFDVERVKSARLKAGRTPATVNRDLDRIRSVFSRAVEWNFLPTHPLKSVKRKKGADDSRTRYLSADEEKRLRSALAQRERDRRAHRQSGNAWCKERGGDGRPMWPADGFTDHLMPLVLVALNTGLRRGELLALEWRSVNLTGKLLTVEAGNAKSSKARHVPLNAEASDVLERWRKQSTDKLVFPGSEGERMGHVNTSWDAVTTAAKLTDFRFHDLRHDFASKLVMAGVDLNTVRELLGHADLKMTLRYAHLAPQKLAAAVALLRVA